MVGKKRFKRGFCLYFAVLLIFLLTAFVHESSKDRSIGSLVNAKYNLALLANFTGPLNNNTPIPMPPTECTPHESTNTSTSGDFDHTSSVSPPSEVKPESPCLSRKESPSYTRRSPYKPTPYLLSKFRNYEELHRRCGPHTAAYNRSITILKESLNTSSFTTTECRYITYGAVYGLGNRIITLASTFLYALLTDRILLVDFGHDMTGLFCEPFPYSSWHLPRDFPGREAGFQHHESLHSILGRYNKAQNGNLAENITLPSISFVNLRSVPGRDNLRIFHCDDGHAILKKIPVLATISDVYFIPSLFMTQSFTDELGKMFPQKEAVFHHLARYMFHPSDEAWGLIKKFYDTNMANADEKVGLQIRVFNPEETTQETVMDHILACTQEHNILPTVDILQQQTTNSSKLQPPDSYKSVMVASLHPNYATNLSEIYGPSRPTPYGEVIEIHQASHDGRQRSGNMRHNLQAWVEMYLLSLCDRLVTSPSSTFGYVAQGLGGLKPWILMDDKQSGSTCTRAATVDPCFHAPPKFDCKTGKMVDSLSNLFSFVKVCEDRPQDGIRLSDDHGER